MDLLDAISKAEAELLKTRDDLKMHKELVVLLQEDLKKRELELHGLRSFAQRAGVDAVSVADADDADVVPIFGTPLSGVNEVGDLVFSSRSEAVATLLALANEPLDRATLHERLIDAGRGETIDEVSLTLSGLKRSGRVLRLGKGMWQIAEPTDATAP